MNRETLNLETFSLDEKKNNKWFDISIVSEL